MNRYKIFSVITMVAFLTACDVDNELDEIPAPIAATLEPANTGTADFTKFVALGASFSAGFTDNALFIAGQENSFPAIMAKQMQAMGGSTTFNQPLMADNIGGMLLNGTPILAPRLYFNGSGPTVLDATPTTEATTPSTNRPFNNFGVPGAKSFHLTSPGYAAANPYFGRMASSLAATVLGDAVAEQPTFFTISEVGGNDVLDYALSGGDGTNPITPTGTFDTAITAIVNALSVNNAKGVIGTVPSITNLAHFTTVPYNPLDPSGEALAVQIPTLNTVYGALNAIYTAVGATERIVTFSTTQLNPVVIQDENLTDLSATITGALNANPDFPAFVQSLGLPALAAPLVANLLGSTYGQSRPATEDDLLLLPSSGIIGEVNSARVQFLVNQGLPQQIAGQFAAEGITLPLEDKWVLLPEEQTEIQNATDAYNLTIKELADGDDNLALLDLNAILTQASTTGVPFDNYLLTTDLVRGGLISLDGIHLTSRGYALMANEFLKVIDTEFGTNFEASGNLAKADDYPTNYSVSFR